MEITEETIILFPKKVFLLLMEISPGKTLDLHMVLRHHMLEVQKDLDIK